MKATTNFEIAESLEGGIAKALLPRRETWDSSECSLVYVDQGLRKMSE